GALRLLLPAFLTRPSRRHHRQDLHRGVVVVHDFSLRRLPDQFLIGGFQHPLDLLHDLPLGGRRQRNSQIPLQSFEAVEGKPLPYFSSAIMLALVSSYFSGPTPSGAFAVNTSPQRLHRNFSSSYTVAFSAAWPTTRTSTPGCAWS